MGPRGNIGYAWKEAAEVMVFSLTQCCPQKYAMDGVTQITQLEEAIVGKDIICTDSLGEDKVQEFREYQITTEIMQKANEHALLNPCPPFFRGEEVSDEVLCSDYFVGYEFKKCLLEVQQAIMLYCIQEIE